MKVLAAPFALVAVAAAVIVPATSAGASTSHDPIGHFDLAQENTKYGGFIVSGWAGDPDSGSSAGLRVHIYVDGKPNIAINADQPRPDVARAHPNLGTHAGFDADTFQTDGRGPHQVCAYAINRGAGANVLLGCRTVIVTLVGALIGHIDSFQVDPSDSGQRIIRGWALDPGDAISPTLFAIVGGGDNVDGEYFAGPVLAGSARADVDAAHPLNGHNHGFQMTVATAGVAWTAGTRVCLATVKPLALFFDDTKYCAIYPG